MNRLKMAEVHAIQALADRGWSYRRIARELGVHRETVSRYAGEGGEAPKPAKAPPGSEAPEGALRPDPGACWSSEGGAKPAKAPPGSEAGRSRCEPHRQLILAKLEEGLSAQRIWQDLRTEHGEAVSYWSVRRFVRRLTRSQALPYRRMECGPGEQVQVDFGGGAPVIGASGKRRRTHVFRMVLSFSRKGYSEAVYRQSTEQFIRCLENALHHFGGVPQTLVPDNLKAAVEKADWYDPELNPKLAAFCEHYGITALPTRPYTPRHKGKIESGIGYVKGNALKGRRFESLEAQNAHLAQWEAAVADTRIHGTTRRQVKQLFEQVEQPALKALPAERFPFFHEAVRTVHRDGHVEVAKAYYSLPPEYVGRQVWARWDTRLVRIYDQKMRPIVTHVRVEPGRFSTAGQHIHPHKISAVERGAGHLLMRADLIGRHTGRWARAMVEQRGVAGIRVLIGLQRLAAQHESQAIERACEVAHSYGAHRLRHVRTLLKRHAGEQEQFEFTSEHEIIRRLSDYTEVAQRAIRRCDDPLVSPAVSTVATSPARGAGDQDRSAGRGPGPQASPRKLEHWRRR